MIRLIAFADHKLKTRTPGAKKDRASSVRRARSAKIGAALEARVPSRRAVDLPRPPEPPGFLLSRLLLGLGARTAHRGRPVWTRAAVMTPTVHGVACAAGAVRMLKAGHHFHHVRGALEAGGFQVLHGFPHVLHAALLLLLHLAFVFGSLFAGRTMPRSRMTEFTLQAVQALPDLMQLAHHLLAMLTIGTRRRAALWATTFRRQSMGTLSMWLRLAAFGGTTVFGARLRFATLGRTTAFSARRRGGTIGLGPAHFLARRRWGGVTTRGTVLGGSKWGEGQAKAGEQQGWMDFHGEDMKPREVTRVAQKNQRVHLGGATSSREQSRSAPGTRRTTGQPCGLRRARLSR